jgi:hypothetical protein
MLGNLLGILHSTFIRFTPSYQYTVAKICILFTISAHLLAFFLGLSFSFPVVYSVVGFGCDMSDPNAQDE